MLKVFVFRSQPEKLTTKFLHRSASFIICSESSDGILMHCLQLSVIFTLSLQIHLSEHVQGRFFTHFAQSGPALGLHRPDNLPALLVSAKSICFTILFTVSTNPLYPWEHHTYPAAIISLSPVQIKLRNGRSCVLRLTTALGGWSGPLG